MLCEVNKLGGSLTLKEEVVLVRKQAMGHHHFLFLPIVVGRGLWVLWAFHL